MHEFFHMGGYAFYVWTSFALALLSVVYLYVSARSLHAKKLKQVRTWTARHAVKKHHQQDS